MSETCCSIKLKQSAITCGWVSGASRSWRSVAAMGVFFSLLLGAADQVPHAHCDAPSVTRRRAPGRGLPVPEDGVEHPQDEDGGDDEQVIPDQLSQADVGGDLGAAGHAEQQRGGNTAC